MGTFVVYAGFMAGCAVAPGWGSFVVLRFLCGLYFSKKGENQRNLPVRAKRIVEADWFSL